MTKNIRKPEPEDVQAALIIAMIVRNEMEDFHVAHLSDAQMAELNPIIRNAVLDALHAIRNSNQNRGAKAYVNFAAALIPSYWEPPRLTESFLKTIEFCEQNPDAPITF